MTEPMNPTEAISEELFRIAQTLNQRLLKRSTEAQSHLDNGEALGAIGAFAGAEDDLDALRTLLRLAHERLPGHRSQGETE